MALPGKGAMILAIGCDADAGRCPQVYSLTDREAALAD